MAVEVGHKFGRLTVRRVFMAARRTRVDAQCDCGNTVSAQARSLASGNTHSCGCLQRERAATAKTTHGQYGTPEYHSWQAAKSRCFNPKDEFFAAYGGRGISMCAEWRDSFEAFLRDMGPRPARASLDRINNEGHYESGNCRWATAKQQANNRRPARRAS